MIAAHSAISGLLADCEALGVRLAAAVDGGLTIDAPQHALTPGLLGRLKAHKAELLTMLGPPSLTSDDFAKPTTTVCRCGSTTWVDVSIHAGRSIRRDCGRCGRFLGFPVWYGEHARHDG